MEQQFFSLYGDVLIKLFLAMGLGMVIGIERVFAHKTVGMRTYALVSMGSALFIIISELVGAQYVGIGGFNPTFIAGQIITGIGFLGTGLIILRHTHLTGITTATSIWVSAGIGMAVGFGFYPLALIVTILTLFIFLVLFLVEHRLREFTDDNQEESEVSDNNKK